MIRAIVSFLQITQNLSSLKLFYLTENPSSFLTLSHNLAKGRYYFLTFISAKLLDLHVPAKSTWSSHL